jgi:hypothetical protein
MVGATGGSSFGRGFSASRIGTGVYSITFPAGTWPSTPMLVVTPFDTGGGGMLVPVVTGLSLGADGSAGFQVTIFGSAGSAANSAFTFVAAAT